MIIRGDVPDEAIIGELRMGNGRIESGDLAQFQRIFRNIEESFWGSETVGLI